MLNFIVLCVLVWYVGKVLAYLIAVYVAWRQWGRADGMSYWGLALERIELLGRRG